MTDRGEKQRAKCESGFTARYDFTNFPREENFFFICILVGMPKLFGISFWVYVK